MRKYGLELAPALFGALVWVAAATPASAQALERDSIVPVAGTPTQRFGSSLAVDGDLLVAGSPMDDTAATNAGAVVVFRRDVTGVWVEEAQLVASDPEIGAQFGSAVAVEGDVIAVGVPMKDLSGAGDAGAVYVFRFDPVALSWTEEQKIVEPGGWWANWFGTSVDLGGDGLIIGATGCDESFGADLGCAFVYRFDPASGSWLVEDMLVDPKRGPGDRAGSAVALEGDLALIASPLSNEASVRDAGTVSVWRRVLGVWQYEQKLLSSHQTKDDQFGSVVALRDGLVLVGAPFEDENSTLVDTGAAHLFRHDGTKYVEEMRFVHPNQAARQQFGADVDLDDDLVLIGAPKDDAFARNAGCAFTFRRARRAWAFDQPYGASDAAADDLLGGAVAIGGARMFVGAEAKDAAAGADWGKVYVYPSAELTLEFIPSAPQPGDTVVASAYYGTPGDPIVTMIVDVNGTPFFVPIFVATFAGDHVWSVAFAAPDPAFGMRLGFRSFKVSEAGPVVMSELASLDV